MYAKRGDRSTYRIAEVIAIAILGLVVYLLATRFDVLEHLRDILSRGEPFELDELLTVCIYASVAMTYFALKRWREAVHRELELQTRNRQLGNALAEVRELRGILPICASCKRIRDDEGYWHQVELYIRDHTQAEFSHGICPECARKLYPEDADELENEGTADSTRGQ